ERALVAVALDRLDPLGVDHATAKDAAGLVVQVAHAHQRGIGAIPEELPRILAGKGANRGDHPAVVLHVVVAVEDVVLAVVLVLGGNGDLAEALLELWPGGLSVLFARIREAAPGGVDLGQ